MLVSVLLQYTEKLILNRPNYFCIFLFSCTVTPFFYLVSSFKKDSVKGAASYYLLPPMHGAKTV